MAAVELIVVVNGRLSPEVTDITAFRIVLNDIISSISVGHIDVTVFGIHSCFRGDKLKWMIVYARLFWVINFENFAAF